MRILITVLCIALASCGFRLRGTAEVPFSTVYLPGATGGIALDLKRNIQAGTNAKVVDDPKQADSVPQSTVELTRDVSFNDAEVLAKEAEEQLLFRDMQSDMVQQIMRRLGAAQKPQPRVQ